MRPKLCSLCDIEITEQNDSKEHVIPNAIGGRKKLKGFICNNCNTNSGDDWDSDLAKQLNPLSLFFGITRERGDAPSQLFETTNGKKLLLNLDGTMDIEKPQYTETPLEVGIKVNMVARSMKEAKHMLKGVKRKYPQADIEELIENAKPTSSYSPDPIVFNLSFGGHKAGRSLVKSALALAVESGVDPKTCEHAREYLLEENGNACFGYYYEKDLILNRPSKTPLHCVHIKGDPATKQLLGYVEFFGIQRMVICLSSTFEGEEFTNNYAVNPINGSKLELDIDLNLSPQDIQDTYDYKKIPQGAVEKICNNIIPLGMDRSYEKEQGRVVNSAIKHAFANCGAKEGEQLLPEHIKKISGLVMEQLEPFILHQLSNKTEKNNF